MTCLPFGGARRYARRSRDGETRFYHSYSRWPALGAVEGVLTGGGYSIALEAGKRAAAALGEGHLHVHALHGSNASILSIERIKEAQMSPRQIGRFLVEH